jgi:polyisoprenoid-binding protein YceI
MTNISGPSSQDVADRYIINSAASKFTVQAFAAGLLSSFGHNPIIAIQDFSGIVELREKMEESSVTMAIQSASLKVQSDVSEKDRIEIERMMHEQVLRSDQYPQIIYTCSRVTASSAGDGQYWAALNGQLTLHGVTKSMTVSARVTANGDSLKASGYFSILQSDYQIDSISVAGGTLKVKDEVKASFEIVAKKQA